ncbi:HEAT repeat protein [Streptomyces sp. LBL]|uniref:NACHT domain-containing protein n=1 Tax=Streptomyces sp. LBL TaxID=2940562 RepID=UPI0024745A21|nr:NACHT domain-containing protein [Streptomyces sp. LBL]MDH6624116.1 HEAT repeat protein [Streptomyces sp. LBL]
MSTDGSGAAGRAIPQAVVAAVDAAVVRVTQGPDSVGTGFFVLAGWILTCAHVHDPDSPARLRIYWHGTELTVMNTVGPGDSGTPDLALIQVDCTDHPILPMGPSGYGIFDFYAYGHQWEDRGYRGYPAAGQANGTTTYRGLPGLPQEPQRLLVLSRATIRPGISGGPLYSLADDRVVGVMKRSNPDGGGYAVPVEDVELLHPNLLAENAEAVAQAGGRVHGEERSAAVLGYLMNLQREHSYVAFANLERDVRLDEVYVTLTLAADTLDGTSYSRRSSGGLHALPDGAPEKRDARRDRGSPQARIRQPDVPLGELLSAPCATVLGEPGAGKTTFLRHLLVRSCRGELFGGDLPVFVRIASLTDEPGCLRTYLTRAYPAVANELLSACDAGKAVFFLDGLDEAPPSLQRRMAEEVRRLLGAQNRFYVSCRTVAFPRGLLPGTFRTFECVGFSRSQRGRFLARWFADRPTTAHDIERQIDESPALSKFGQNPLMLSLLSAAQGDQDEIRIPRQRTELYAVLADVLLNGRESPGVRSSPLLKRSFLSWLALELMTRRRESFGEEEFYGLWNDYVARRPAGAAPADSPYDMLRTLAEQDAILLRGADGRYSFLHLTFQEYFAARALSAASPEQDNPLFGHCHDPRWEEVTRLYTGLLQETRAEEFIRRLAFTPDGEARSVEALTLAARCASEALPEAAPVCDELLDRLGPVAFGRGSPFSVEATHAVSGLAAAFPEYVDTVAARLFPREEAPPLDVFLKYVAFLGLVASGTAGTVLAGMLRNLLATDPTTAAEPLAARYDLEGYVLSTVEVIEALGRCGRPEAVPLLAPLLEHPMSAVAGAAGQALTEIPLTPETIRPLLTGGDGAPLGRLRAPLAVRVISSEFVRQTMRTLFVDAPDPLSQLSIRHAVDPEWVEGDGRFHARLLSEAPDDHSRANMLCLTSLGVYAEHTEHVLATALDPAADLRLRAAAVSFLLRCRPKHTAELVTGLLDEGDRTLVAAATAALARSGSTQAHGILLERSLRPGQDWLLSLCLRLFSQVPIPACRSWLRTVLAERCGPDDSERLRRVIFCSATLRDLSVLPALGGLLSHSGPDGLADRVMAYRALARLEHPRGEALLLRALAVEDDSMAAVQGIDALGTLRTPNAESTLMSYLDPATWPRRWPARAPHPGQGEQRPSDQRVLAAVVALARTGTVRAVGALEQLGGRPSESAGLRRVAYEAVRTIRYYSETEEA